MDRNYWARHIAGLDPETEYEQIYRIMTTHEFPWDMNQSLSFALYRTYAVPGIGRLLKRTGEFTERTQKRYDDTALILDTVLEHGLASEPGRAAIRRMNRFAPRAAVTRFAKALMDDPLLDAFGYRRPAAWERSLAAGALRLRGRVVRRLPPRREPLYARQLPDIRSYPDGYEVADLGTFPQPSTPDLLRRPPARVRPRAR